MRAGIPLALLFVAGLVALFWQPLASDPLPRPRIPDYSLEEIKEVYRKQERLEAEVQHALFFHAELERAKTALWTGKWTLAQAAETLLPLALNHPRYLSSLRQLSLERSDLRRIARNLLDHLSVDLENGRPQASSEILIELECQLDTLPPA